MSGVLARAVVCWPTRSQTFEFSIQDLSWSTQARYLRRSLFKIVARELIHYGSTWVPSDILSFTSRKATHTLDALLLRIMQMQPQCATCEIDGVTCLLVGNGEVLSGRGLVLATDEIYVYVMSAVGIQDSHIEIVSSE